jgi:hypothetical protein
MTPAELNRGLDLLTRWSAQQGALRKELEELRTGELDLTAREKLYVLQGSFDMLHLCQMDLIVFLKDELLRAGGAGGGALSGAEGAE